MLSVEGAYATGFNRGRVSVLMDRRFESSPLHVTALGRVSDIQFVGFNGFGNATSDSGHAQSFFDVHQRQWFLNPAVGLSLGSWTDISLGPVVQHSVVDSARSPFLAETRPYGFGTFNQAGLMLNAKYERVPAPGEDETFVRDRYLVQATGAYYPAMWDVRSPFEVASLALGASFEIPIATRPLFVARAGGKKLFGDFPFYEAAVLGGHETTQYITSQRYAGDGSLYATSELYVPLDSVHVLDPGARWRHRRGRIGPRVLPGKLSRRLAFDDWRRDLDRSGLRVRDVQHRSNDWRTTRASVPAGTQLLRSTQR